VSVHGLESVPRYRELLDRLLGEELDFIPQGFILEQDDEELAFLKREEMFVGQVLTAGPTAAQASFVQLLNPVNSQRLIKVTDIFVLTAAASNVQTALTTTVRGASGGGGLIPVDTRWNTPIIPAAALAARDPATPNYTSGTSVAFGTDVLLGTFASPGTWIRLPHPVVVLAPGTGLEINDQTINQAMSAFFAGRSRIARPEEIGQ